MGRTVLPYSMQLERVIERFKQFRRGLRKEDQEVLDKLFIMARVQVQAGVMAANPNPADSLFMTLMIELYRQIEIQSKEIENLKESMANSEAECSPKPYLM